jgi:mRNA interferase RelE/StbE
VSLVSKYDVSLSKKAFKFLAKQESAVQQRIAQAIEGLRVVPPEGDVQPMKGMAGFFRLRVGSYRILFQVNHSDGSSTSKSSEIVGIFTSKTLRAKTLGVCFSRGG